MRSGEGQNKGCRPDADEDTIQPRLEAETIQFEQGKRADGDQEQRQGPGSEVDDDEVDRRDQRSRSIETPEIELFGACWWGGHGCRAVGDCFGDGWMSHMGYEDTVLSTRPKRRSRF